MNLTDNVIDDKIRVRVTQLRDHTNIENIHSPREVIHKRVRHIRHGVLHMGASKQSKMEGREVCLETWLVGGRHRKKDQIVKITLRDMFA